MRLYFVIENMSIGKGSSARGEEDTTRKIAYGFWMFQPSRKRFGSPDLLELQNA
jgi:hypothetical protein